MINYLKKAKSQFILSNVISVIEVILTSVYPSLLMYIIDNFHFLTKIKILQISLLFVASIILLLFTIYINKVTKQKYERKIETSMRKDLFESLTDSCECEFSANSPDTYASFLVNDIKVIYTEYFENLIYFVNSILKLLTYAIILVRINWIMCLVIMGSLFLLIYMPNLVGKNFDTLNKTFSSSNASYLETISSFLVSHEILNGKEASVKHQHLKSLNLLQDAQFKRDKYKSFIQVFSGSALYIQLIICFIAGMTLCYKGFMTIGILSSCMIYVEYIAQSSCSLLDEWLEMKGCFSYRKKFLNLVSMDKAELKNKPLLPNGKRNIEIQNVSYSVNSRNIISNLSYSFASGKKYLITGENGSGKSTLIKIIIGHIHPSSGSVSIDENDFSYMSQNRYLFKGTVDENIFLFEKNSAEQRKTAHEYLERLSFKHAPDYMIDKDGTNLSGGEKAKLCLLRSLMQEKGILLIDEPFNDIDSQSGRLIEDFLSSTDKTVIIVSHIHYDIKHFDEILKIEDGKIFSMKSK